MKRAGWVKIFVLALILFLISNTANAQQLYISGGEIWKGYLGSGEEKTLHFVFSTEGNQKIAFAEVKPSEEKKISDSELKELDLKSSEWLLKKYSSFHENGKVDENGVVKVFDLNKEFESIYIVILNKDRSGATITKVKQLDFFDI